MHCQYESIIFVHWFKSVIEWIEMTPGVGIWYINGARRHLGVSTGAIYTKKKNCEQISETPSQYAWKDYQTMFPAEKLQ